MNSIKYLEEFFYNSSNIRYKDDGKYQFRNIFDHCKRVYTWAKRINEVEKGNELVVSISSLFHDIGKIYDNDHYTHALKSSEICKDYLNLIDISEEIKNKILYSIEIHPYKENDDINLSIEDKILMDADLLDEVGILTLVWDSMATALESNPSYEKVCERASKYYNKVSTKTQYLKTNTGKKLYTERLIVLKKSIENLQYELNINC